MNNMHVSSDAALSCKPAIVDKKRLLILVIAYNAEATISEVVNRIPESLHAACHTEVLVIDDCSADSTFETAVSVKCREQQKFPMTVLYNPENLGYGGNQKIGYQYAIANGYDYVAMLHGDGQYAPEYLPALLQPLLEDQADAVFGSRMMLRGAALKGGMPYYKFFGNKILTWFENRLLGAQLTEFHSGYRLYSVKALSSLPFRLNTNDFHFDTEIIIQFVLAGYRIKELPIPTYYGTEICHVNGLAYAGNVIAACVKAKMQATGLFYARNFDCAQVRKNNPQKLGYPSTYTEAIKHIRPGSRVLDLGCNDGSMGIELKKRLHCQVVGVDKFPSPDITWYDQIVAYDLNVGLPELDYTKFDTILLLDVLEHLHSPEDFLRKLYDILGAQPSTQLIVSTGNIGFFIPRFMLLFGGFNYGKSGILDMTHTRLFTWATFRTIFEQHGFVVESQVGVPAPYPLALGDNTFARCLVRINQLLIRLFKGLCSYQILLQLRSKPSLSYLLNHSIEASAIREQSTHAQ